MSNRSLDLIKGTLDVLILKTVSWGPLHGYAISRFLRDTTDAAFQVEEGALYPALRRLEKKGWLASEWGLTDTGRQAKFYRLTPAGSRQLEVELDAWNRYVEAMARVLFEARPTQVGTTQARMAQAPS
ncbi:MAG: PadR family transcriptional regulator [Holophagales bacterium]|nr:PadR family transcriptional regulator [Holophagales bacterium]